MYCNCIFMVFENVEISNQSNSGVIPMNQLWPLVALFMVAAKMIKRTSAPAQKDFDLLSQTDRSHSHLSTALTSTSSGSPGATRRRPPRVWSCTSPSCSATGSTPRRSSAGRRSMSCQFPILKSWVTVIWLNFCSAMMKHGVEGNPDDFTLSQLLPDKGAIYILHAS